MSDKKSFDSSSKAFLPLDNEIPKYGMHVHRNLITLGDSHLLGVVEFQGKPFETIMPGELERDSDHLVKVFNYLAKINAPWIECYTHIVKRREKIHLNMEFENDFSKRFADKYLEPFKAGQFFTTKYYLSIVYKYKDMEKGIAKMADALGFVKNVGAEFGVKVLGMQNNNGVLLSEIGQFLASLVNANQLDDNRVTVNAGLICDKLQQTKIFFGSDLAEFRTTTSRKFGTFYDLMEYAPLSRRGMWNSLLSIQTEFVLTQSFFPYSMSKSSTAVETQLNKLASSSRPPVGFMAELEQAKSALAQGDLTVGDYHATLTVFSDTAAGAVDQGDFVASQITSSSGAMFVKATSTGHKSFYSHLPGSQYKPFSEPKTSRNLVNGWSLASYPIGKAYGNPIGDGYALMPLKTRSDSLYYFNTHYSDIDKNNLGEKMLGHCLILGMSGAGKTTFEGVLANFIGRFNGKMFGIDFNKSMQLFFESLGGKYFDIEEGVYTGLNPFQLPDSPGVRAFLYGLLAACGRNSNGDPVTAVEESKIKNAVDTIMEIPFESRRFSQVKSMIPPEGDNGIGDRLAKWQTSCDGTFAWALDSPENLFNPEEFNRIAFNCTDILNDGGSVVTEPILAVLFQIKDMMQEDGELMTTFVEEFWVPANFPATQEKIKGTLKAGRIKNEHMFLVSQSPADAIRCEIFPAIIEQTATKVYLPNKLATWEEYSQCGLNEKEFEELQALGQTSRTFLVVQDGKSVMCKLDLYGFDEFLPVISATWDGIELANKIRAELGTDDVRQWVPPFIEQINQK